MTEYLMTVKEGDDTFPALDQTRLAAVLTPPVTLNCSPADGWGAFGLRCGDTNISFSLVPPGIQATFEGPMSQADADALVTAISAQIESEAGRSIEWWEIT